jgi:Catalase
MPKIIEISGQRNHLTKNAQKPILPGSGADGSFVCTKADMLQYTTTKLFSAAGKRTPILLRFSTVDSEKGFADSTKVWRLHSHLEA